MDVVLSLILAYAGHVTPVIVRPPSIAHAAGMTIGLTTVPGFERRYGKGLPSMGGHSGGARTWYDLTSHALIHADGFNYAVGGEVLEGYDIHWRPNAVKNIPCIRLRRNDLGFLGKLRPGMSRKEVENSLHVKLAGDMFTATGLIKYSDRVINKQNDRYTKWDLHFDFGPKGLESFGGYTD